MIRSTYENPMSFLNMLLEVEVILIGIVTQVARVRPYILVGIHMALIAWKEGKSFVTNIALVELLVILYVNTLDVLFPLMICFKKFVTKRTWQSWCFM